MAVIHRTTMNPGKLELLASWLPSRPWYAGTGRAPELSKAGGFRLDDPEGEVGIEFMVVTDVSGDEPVAYHLPLTYRGVPLDGAEDALVGTSEHGVLGKRWVYDGIHDPVLVAQLLALLEGRAEPQAQSLTDAPDHSVIGRFDGGGLSAVSGPGAVEDGPQGTDLAVRAAVTGASPLTLTVTRVLDPDRAAPATGATNVRGHVSAEWNSADGERRRGAFVVVS
ncbi:maltokinase N-terminal cap-like domain-containing protein [Streptomyces vilmorinianum]|uniref:maltokinase N-terminal cap-like domain-containing protein n=1 Tax=Streptomyces vilmorinianum TaxID=3051092 RepID=UPI0010FB3B2C|nr:1,4-alpha-glucan branching protein [Streptomyces vilmorinianum]